MTTPPATAAPPATRRAAASSSTPGVVLVTLLLAIYGSLALGVDFPRAATAIYSDEATYYMMGHSLAEDGDLTYRREDLVRVWREFPSGPSGIFLKKGRDVVDGGLMLRPPFFWTTTAPDTDPSRLFYGKSFLYPALAWPFIELLGTNGFLFFNALTLALVVWCSFLFLQARMPAGPAALLAGAFTMATVVPVYFVWIQPELLNFALGLLGYFCIFYREVTVRERAARATHWTFGTVGDLAAAVLLGMATFSKVTSALLFPPLVLWMLWRRRWIPAVASSVLFLAVTVGLFAANTMITGEWNYQGGERETFNFEFPFQKPSSTLEAMFEGDSHGRDEAMTDVMFPGTSPFFTNLLNNIKWYFVGRYAGLFAYFFPAVFALGGFLLARRHRLSWQYFVLAGVVGQIALFIITLPYTWAGGGGSVGNRYFIGAYGAVLFLIPPVQRVWIALIPWAVGGLFMAKLVLNPFATSIRPGEYADAGPLRIFPVELSNTNDIPINTDHPRVRQWFGDHPELGSLGFQIYFLDRNQYGREDDQTFWVKGKSRAEVLVKVDRPFRRLKLVISAGPLATEVEARVAGRSQSISLSAGQSHELQFALPPGYHYEGRAFVWVASISTSSGFVPLFTETGSDDPRFLGVKVKPMIVP
jgi:hypothetical protein